MLKYFHTVLNFLPGSQQNVVLVFALLFRAVPEGGDAVAVLAVVIPFAWWNKEIHSFNI